MGISRADLLKELVPALNKVFEYEFEDYRLGEAEEWLSDTYPDIGRTWNRFKMGMVDWSQLRPYVENLEKWLEVNYPEQYAVYELWRSTAELEGK